MLFEILNLILLTFFLCNGACQGNINNECLRKKRNGISICFHREDTSVRYKKKQTMSAPTSLEDAISIHFISPTQNQDACSLAYP